MNLLFVSVLLNRIFVDMQKKNDSFYSDTKYPFIQNEKNIS